MAGGIWTSQNKVRPGAYINFEGEPVSTINISDRGVVALALPLSWGTNGEIINLTANDLITGKSLAKVGLVFTDEESLVIRLALQNARQVKLYNSNAEGVKANAVLGETGITAIAKYSGTFGNKIAIVIKSSENVFVVETYANGYFVDSQKITEATQLQNNDYVTFTLADTTNLTTIASTLLTGGTNGDYDTEYLTKFFNALVIENWNVLAITSNNTTEKTQAVEFIRRMREDEGKYVQGVIANMESTGANYEGIINVVNGVVYTDGVTVTPEQFTVWVAGATAGAGITTSLTGVVVEGAVGITGQLDNDSTINALNTGKFVLSYNQNGTVKVEKDINSYHIFSADKSYIFSKNRVIRELDEIGSSIKNIWETTYLGKVSNNEAGRTLFKSSIIEYLTSLENIGAIEEFDANSVVVEIGNDIDSVIASIAIKPVDSMEFLYMTVNVVQS